MNNIREAGVNPTAKNDNGETPLDCVIEKGNADVIELLQKA